MPMVGTQSEEDQRFNSNVSPTPCQKRVRSALGNKKGLTTIRRKSFPEKSRDDSRCTFVNETAGVGLVLGLFPQVIHFDGDAVTQFVEPGLYAKRKK